MIQKIQKETIQCVNLKYMLCIIRIDAEDNSASDFSLLLSISNPEQVCRRTHER